MLVLLLVANEFLRDRLSNLRLLVSLYALVCFAFFTFFLPVMTGYMNADSYQIIGPGLDGKYGDGGMMWSPQTAATIYSHGHFGADDLANFYGTSVLGSSAR